MKTILAATDGSVDAQNAVRWAVDLSGATGAEVVIATAWHPGFAEVPPEEHAELRATAETRLEEEWCGYARTAGVRHRSVVLDGDARAAVLPAADDVDADLIVVGARGLGGRGHWLHLGSVTTHLVHHTERPLATIPASAHTEWPTTIVVGVDGSEHSGRVLGWVVALPAGASTDVVATYAEVPSLEFALHDSPRSWYHRAMEDLEGWVDDATGGGAPVRLAVVDHASGPGLVEEAGREHAGLIVVGARGIGRVTGVRLGGTALKVLHHANLPVIVVP